MINKPYVKQYSETGEVSNPIIGSYSQPFKNREQRRFILQKQPFMGNGKQTPITISGTVKYLRSVQIIPSTKKRINHYTLIK